MSDAKRQRIGATQWGFHVGSPSVSSHVLDASNDGIGFMFRAESDDPITHLGFRYGVRTGSGSDSPPTQVCTLEGISATTGMPDGTDVGGGSPTAATFTPPNDTSFDNTFQWIALTNAFTPTVGARYGGTIRYSSGTISGTNNSSWSTDVANIGAGGSHLSPAAFRLTSGTWTRRAAMPLGGVRTASTRYGYLWQDVFLTRSASTVGHRQALKFVLPGTGTYKIRGARFTSSLASAAGKNPLFNIWSASAALQSVTLDTDVEPNTTNGNHYVVWPDALATLTGGTTYYVGLEVADAASAGVLLYGAKLSEADDLLAFAGGTQWHLATFDGSSWTDDQTVRPYMELALEDIAEPSAGGIIIGSRRNTLIGR